MVALQETQVLFKQLSDAVSSADTSMSEKLRAVKQVKNAAIGNRPRKALLLKLHVASSLVFALSDLRSSDAAQDPAALDQAEQLMVEAATVLGTLALGAADTDTFSYLINANPVPVLLDILNQYVPLLNVSAAAAGADVAMISSSSTASNASTKDNNNTQNTQRARKIIEAVARALKIILAEGSRNSHAQTYKSVTSALQNPAVHQMASVNAASTVATVAAASGGISALHLQDKAGHNTDETSWKSAVFKGQYIMNIISLLHATETGTSLSSMRIAQVAASIIANIATTNEEQNIICSAGAIRPLINLLASTYPRLQEAALEALAQLCLDNRPAGDAIVSHHNTVPTLLRFLRSPRDYIRLLTCNCLTNFKKTGALPREHIVDIEKQVLPTLVRLFSVSNDTIQEKAPLVFATLISDSEQLQKQSIETESITKLVQLLNHNIPIEDPKDKKKKSTSPSSSNTQLASKGDTEIVDAVPGTRPPESDLELCNIESEQGDRIKESALLALAALSALLEPSRKSIIESPTVLPVLVASLRHRKTGIRSAACLLCRSLSRSVKNLRTHLVDAGIAQPLFALLEDEDLQVRIMASATLCNIVLDFSPMKKTVLDSGVIGKLVTLSHEQNSQLRLNSVWGLKNLLYQADSSIKSSVMKSLTYTHLQSLINDPEIKVQEQAFGLLRNLACGREADIQSVLDGIGLDSLRWILLSKLDDMTRPEEVVEQALFFMVNLATGNDTHKKVIMDDEALLHAVLRFMGHTNSMIRCASIWCVINLTWPDEQATSNTEQSITRLKELGFEEKLKALVNDSELDVKERAQAALNHFSGKPRESQLSNTTVDASGHTDNNNNDGGSSDANDSIWNQGFGPGGTGGPGGRGGNNDSGTGGGSGRRGSLGRRLLPPQMGFSLGWTVRNSGNAGGPGGGNTVPRSSTGPSGSGGGLTEEERNARRRFREYMENLRAGFSMESNEF